MPDVAYKATYAPGPTSARAASPRTQPCRVSTSSGGCWRTAPPSWVASTRWGSEPGAGPVAVGAVVLDPADRIYKLRDSKLLDPARREWLAQRVRGRCVGHGVGLAWPTRDRRGRPLRGDPPGRREGGGGAAGDARRVPRRRQVELHRRPCPDGGKGRLRVGVDRCGLHRGEGGEGLPHVVAGPSCTRTTPSRPTRGIRRPGTSGACRPSGRRPSTGGSTLPSASSSTRAYRAGCSGEGQVRIPDSLTP